MAEMKPLAVVKHLYVSEYPALPLLPGYEGAVMDQLSLQGAEKRFRDDVVEKRCLLNSLSARLLRCKDFASNQKGEFRNLLSLSLLTHVTFSLWSVCSRLGDYRDTLSRTRFRHVPVTELLVTPGLRYALHIFRQLTEAVDKVRSQESGSCQERTGAQGRPWTALMWLNKNVHHATFSKSRLKLHCFFQYIF
jgi:hypothetical protein